MRRSVLTYTIVLNLVFWLSVVAAFLTGHAPPAGELALIAPLFGVAIAAEALIVQADQDSFSFSTIAHIAAAVLIGPVAAGLIAALAVIVVDGARMLPRRHVALNSSMFGLAIMIGGGAFQLAGGQVGVVNPANLFPLFLLIVVRMAVNEVVLAGAVSVALGRSPGMVLVDALPQALPSLVAEGCLGVLLAFGYRGDRWVILPFLLPLLGLVYHASASYERLKREAQRTLESFAKVIDERDRSTAQHSERVAEYVERFALAIGLGEREVTRLVDSARYHDLGKISVDVATLSSSERLSEKELRSIRRHPRLSARLLAPFHFAEKMAIYAELHHERYDGHGYYSVSQREIPVEAHVLIVADSFDAMTSARAYRPPLTQAEALQEVRDKAGTQFHPLVANAFASMMEGRDVQSALGRTQVSALRAEFSLVPVFGLGWLRVLCGARAAAVGLGSLGLVTLGIPSVPGALSRTLIGGGITLGLWRVVADTRGRRRVKRAMAVHGERGSVTEALRSLGVGGWIAWLVWDAEEEIYLAEVEDGTPSTADLEEVCKRALRPGSDVLSGELSSGTRIAITAAADDQPRLVVGEGRVSADARTLMEQLAAHGRGEGSGGAEPVLEVLDGDQRARMPQTSVGVILIDLATFENVRVVAGQLSAERVVADATTRLEALLRGGDQLIRLDEDRYGVVLAVSTEAQLDAVCARVHNAVSEVPVPRRATQIRPRLRAALGAAALSHPDFARLLESATDPVQHREAG